MVLRGTPLSSSAVAAIRRRSLKWSGRSLLACSPTRLTVRFQRRANPEKSRISFPGAVRINSRIGSVIGIVLVVGLDLDAFKSREPVIHVVLVQASQVREPKRKVHFCQ
jgi:hypothetical protein